MRWLVVCGVAPGREPAAGHGPRPAAGARVPAAGPVRVDRGRRGAARQRPRKRPSLCSPSMARRPRRSHALPSWPTTWRGAIGLAAGATRTVRVKLGRRSTPSAATSCSALAERGMARVDDAVFGIARRPAGRRSSPTSRSSVDRDEGARPESHALSPERRRHDPLPNDEGERVSALRRYAVLDQPPAPDLDAGRPPRRPRRRHADRGDQPRSTPSVSGRPRRVRRRAAPRCRGSRSMSRVHGPRTVGPIVVGDSCDRQRFDHQPVGRTASWATSACTPRPRSSPPFTTSSAPSACSSERAGFADDRSGSPPSRTWPRW